MKPHPWPLPQLEKHDKAEAERGPFRDLEEMAKEAVHIAHHLELPPNS